MKKSTRCKRRATNAQRSSLHLFQNSYDRDDLAEGPQWHLDASAGLEVECRRLASGGGSVTITLASEKVGASVLSQVSSRTSRSILKSDLRNDLQASRILTFRVCACSEGVLGGHGADCRGLWNGSAASKDFFKRSNLGLGDGREWRDDNQDTRLDMGARRFGMVHLNDWQETWSSRLDKRGWNAQKPSESWLGCYDAMRYDVIPLLIELKKGVGWRNHGVEEEPRLLRRFLRFERLASH